jgi:hypothetical protein
LVDGEGCITIIRATPKQREVLLSLAEDGAAMHAYWQNYRLREGDGDKIATSTAASLVRHGWAHAERLENSYRLTITPEGLKAVQDRL